MSWSGGGGFFGPASKTGRVRVTAAPTDAIPAALPAGLEQLRAFAMDAYTKGRLDEATLAQTEVLAKAADALDPDDILFAGLLHHAAGRLDTAASLLARGTARFPNVPALHENLAVTRLAASDFAGAIEACQAALALGSDSTNLHDTLCEAFERLGRPDLAVAEGRLSLTMKDRRFGAAVPLVRIPDCQPPAFNPNRPDQNIIAYTLWGNQHRYHVPLLENARLRPHLFPEWTIRVHHDHSVDAGYLRELAAHGVQLRRMELSPDLPGYRRLLWRFDVIADPDVARFLIRDADSLLTIKERVAVEEWLRSRFHFHMMRDWYTHTDLILAGMWAGVGNILPAPSTLLGAYKAWRVETSHVDQDVLSETVWPCVRNNILIHDSIFHPCLGSVPFPPFGMLPEGHHVGQNAFLHFSKSV